MTQTIYRPARRAQYTVVSNALLNDAKLSPAALGVLVYLLSRPDDWVIHREQLMARFKIGREKFQAIFRELSGLHYARLEAVADAHTGQLAGTRWVIFEEPESETREPENPSLGNGTDERVSRQSTKPTVGKPGPLLNTDSRPITETKQKTVSPLPPKGATEGGEGLGDEGEAISAADAPNGWGRFQAAWHFDDDATESIGAAERDFDKLSPEDQEAAIRHAGEMRARTQKTVYASTYLKERRWESSRASGHTALVAASGITTPSAAHCVKAWVEDGSSQWHAWRAHYDAQGKPPLKPMQTLRGFGRFMDTAWPPGYAAVPA